MYVNSCRYGCDCQYNSTILAGLEDNLLVSFPLHLWLWLSVSWRTVVSNQKAHMGFASLLTGDLDKSQGDRLNPSTSLALMSTQRIYEAEKIPLILHYVHVQVEHS